MENVTLGRTGFKITQLGYGALELGRARAGEEGNYLSSDENAGQVLNAVLDSGINFIDTSWCYGRSEELMGRYIAHRRNEYVLATKAGHGRCNATRANGYTKKDMMTHMEESLKRLGTDHVDIVQLHNPNPDDVEQNGCIETLQEMKAKSMTRFIGVSSVLPHLEKHLATGAYDVFQLPYSALEPEHHDIITKIARAGGGTIIRGGVAKGEPGVGMAPEGRRFSAGGQRWGMFEQAKLNELLEEGETRTAFMLRCTMSHPEVHTIIVGTRNLDHLKENVNVAEKGPLPPRVYTEARRWLKAVGIG